MRRIALLLLFSFCFASPRGVLDTLREQGVINKQEAKEIHRNTKYGKCINKAYFMPKTSGFTILMPRCRDKEERDYIYFHEIAHWLQRYHPERIRSVVVEPEADRFMDHFYPFCYYSGRCF